MFWAAISWHNKSPLLQLHWEEVRLDKNGRARKAGFAGRHYAEQVVLGGLREFWEAEWDATGVEMLVVEDGAPAHKGPEV